MNVYVLSQSQRIDVQIDVAWNFFSNPKNLSLITPPSMQFEILDDANTKSISAGQLIYYKVSPFPYLRTRWVTEITRVTPGHSFVDKQKKGPFAVWQHEHKFVTIGDSVEMIDIVHYAPPLGWLGAVANWLVIRKRVEYIFNYRRKRVEEIFPPRATSMTKNEKLTPVHI